MHSRGATTEQLAAASGLPAEDAADLARWCSEPVTEASTRDH
jgi:hypothetical protein